MTALPPQSFALRLHVKNRRQNLAAKQFQSKVRTAINCYLLDFIGIVVHIPSQVIIIIIRRTARGLRKRLSTVSRVIY